jgi:cytochrome c-type biogenesis protein CcmH/NrfG
VSGPSLVKVDIRDFQAWSAEFKEFPYSEREIFQALRQLKQLELINVAKTELTIRAKGAENQKVQSKLNKVNFNQAKQLLSRFPFNPYIALIVVTLFVSALKFAPLSQVRSTQQPQTQSQNLINPDNK